MYTLSETSLQIFKLARLIDHRFDDIIHRKEHEIGCGRFTVHKKLHSYNDRHQYWEIAISIQCNYTKDQQPFLHFFDGTGDVENITNFYSPGSQVVFNTYRDDCVVFLNESGTNPIYTIPYDQTGSVDERQMSVDLTIDGDIEREFMYNVIQFQALRLKNIKIAIYKEQKKYVLQTGEIYKDISTRPFFKYK